MAEGGPEQAFLGEIHTYGDKVCCLIRVSSICLLGVAEGGPE